MAVSNSQRVRGGLWGSGKEVHGLSQIALQPAPIPRTPFVQAPRYEAGSNLTKLAQGLRSLNQGLNNLANVDAQQKADPNSRENREYQAKIQQMSLDELQEEARNNTPHGVRIREDILNIALANKGAAAFKLHITELYNTQFDKTGGNLEEFIETERQNYAATLPTDLSRGAFYSLTEGFKDTLHTQNQEHQIAYTKQQMGSTLSDTFRNTIEDAVTQGKTPEEAAALVFSNAASMSDFMYLTPQERDQAILKIVQENVLKGDVAMVKALVETDRGALGKALIHEDSDLAIQALNLVKQAEAIDKGEKVEKDWRIIADFNTEVSNGTLDEERAEYYASTGSLAPSTIGTGLAKSKEYKVWLLKNHEKDQAAQQALDTHNQAKYQVVGAAFVAMQEVGGIIRISDVEIPNEKGTGTTTLTRQQIIDTVIEHQEAEWEDIIAQAEDPAQALATVTQDRIKWYASNNLPNKRWEAQLSGLAARLPHMDLAKGGKLTDHAKSAAQLYRDIKSTNPAYLDSLSIDKNSLEFLEGYEEALEMGMDEEAALLDASLMSTRPDAEKRKVQLEPKKRANLVADIAYDLGVDERSHHLIEQKVIRLSERGATEPIIKERLKKELERSSFVHNGVLIFNHRDLPPDFLPLVNDLLKQTHEVYKKDYGLPDNVDDLYIDRDSTGSHWVIRSKSLAGAVIGSRVINADTLAEIRQGNRMARQLNFRQALAASRQQERLRGNPAYDFEQEAQNKIDYWQKQLEASGDSWKSQIITNNIERLTDDLINNQASQMVRKGIYPNSKQWNAWKAEHGRDVSELEELYQHYK